MTSSIKPYDDSELKHQEIIAFTERFSDYGVDVIDCFTTRNCYWFAVILQNRFGGKIMYHPIYGHFVCKINGRLYDISGEPRLDDGWIDWEEYVIVDPIHRARIIKDCIE